MPPVGMRRAAGTALLMVLMLCLPAGSEAEPMIDGVVIEHVTVLPMTPGGAPITEATVAVRDGLITRVEKGGQPQECSRRRCVDGSGMWLMPGLADMHVHILNRGHLRLRSPEVTWPEDFLRTQDVLLPFIANGVTQILDMSSMPESLEQSEEVAAGEVLGPHYATAGEVDGEPTVWGAMAREAGTPEEGRKAVREIEEAGYDFVKVYSRLDIATYRAILDEAQARGIRVIGHLPDAGRGCIRSVLVPGMDLVAHAEEFAKQSANLSDDDIFKFAHLAKDYGTWITPTLITMEWIADQTRRPEIVAENPDIRFMHPLLVERWIHDNRYVAEATPERAELFDRIAGFNTRLVRAFTQSGIPMMPGTDAIIPGIVYGFSLHDELEMLAGAGVPNLRVLESATRLPAEFLGVADRRGTVEVGKQADLLLLEGDPTVDIANTRRIAAVIIGGRYLGRDELDDKMAYLERRYSGMSADYPAGQPTSDDD